MFFGLNEHVLNRIALIGCLVAMLSSGMLWYEGLYPVSMRVDFMASLVLGVAFFYRRRLSAQQRTSLITLAGIMIGVASVYSTPLYADGFLVLAGVMALSFVSWSGWRAWLIPTISVISVLIIGLGVSMGAIGFEKSALPDTDSVAIWVLTAMSVALLAIALGGAVGDLKRRLNKQMKVLIDSNNTLFVLANTEPITGLANRRRLEELVDHDVSLGKGGCLLNINLSHFRLFVALHGHARGDELLVNMAGTLSHLVSEDMLVAALAGAQFAVWMPGCSVQECARFYDAFVAQFKVTNNAAGILGAHAGIAVADAQTDSFSQLIQNAAVALSDAHGRAEFSWSSFSPAMAKSIEDANRLKLTVRTALDAQGFYPVYQKKVNAFTGQVCGVEGLARMTALASGNTPGPVDFIPVIHNEGWMMEFGALMLRKIVRDVPQLMALYGANAKVSVNISPPLYLAAEFLPLLSACLEETGAPPQNIVIEITEEVFTSNLEDIVAVTNQIRQLGVEVSLDDFGTGFSSLSFLRAVHFDEIKIDRSFIQQIEQDEKSNILLTAIVDLGLALDSRMVVEGVETENQLNIVKNAGCAIIQGFYYSRPTLLAQL